MTSPTNRRWTALLPAAALALTAACAVPKAPPRSAPSNFRGDLTGLDRTWDHRLDEAWLRPGVRLSDYTRIRVEPARLAPDLDTGRDEYRDHDLEIVRKQFQERVTDSLDEDFLLVDETGRDVLELRLLLTGIKANRPPLDARRRGGPTQYPTTTRGVGWATMQLELRDSETGELLFAAVDRYDGVTFDRNLGIGFTWSDAQRAFDGWGRALRARLIDTGYDG